MSIRHKQLHSYEFIAFRTLHDVVPMTEETANMICECLNNYLTKTRKSPSLIEKLLVQYKLQKM